MKVTPRLLPFAVLLISLLWGSAFPAIKAIYAEWELIGVPQNLPNRFVLAGVRFVIAGIALLCIAKQPWIELKKTPRLALFGFACGQTYFQYVMFYTALAKSSAVLGGLLIGSGSIWWMILAPLILKTTWPTKRQWALIGLAVIGVLIAVYKPGAGSGDPILGAVLFCLSTLSGALALIILQRILPTMGAKAATGFGLLLGGVMLLLTGAASWSHIPELFTMKVILITVYLAAVSAIGFSLWNYLTSQFSVNLLAGYRFLVPICAVVESSLFVSGESPGVGIWIGGICVVVSLCFLQRMKNNG